MQNEQALDVVYAQNAAKTLATNIRFTSIDKPIRTMVVTSSIPNEGKSSISISLAEAMVGESKRVLLVECDMRRRSLAGMLGVHAQKGIYEVLSGKASLQEAVVDSGFPGMDFLDCEPHITNPVDVLQSKRFKSFIKEVSEEYSFVLFDTPPLTTFIDAAVIGGLVDGCALVVRRNFTGRDEILNSYKQLKKGGANILGTVLNFCDMEKSSYYYSYYSKSGDGSKSLGRSSGGSSLHSPLTGEPPAQMPKRRSVSGVSFETTELDSAMLESPAPRVAESNIPDPFAPAPKQRSGHQNVKNRLARTTPEIDPMPGNLKPLSDEPIPPISPSGYYYPSGYDD